MDMRLLLLRIAAMLQTWVILCPQAKKLEFTWRLEKLKSFAFRPPRIAR